MNTYSSLATNNNISSKLLNTVNISSLPMRTTTKVICSTGQNGFREPTVLVMEDGATATLYSALDGTTVLEGPDGATTVLPSSPQSEVGSAGEVLLSDSSKTSLVLRRGHAITAATSQGTSSKGAAAVSSESASTTSSTTLHVLPKNVEAILVANNGVNLCGGTYVTKSQSERFSVNSSNSVSVISSVFKKSETSPSATRFYSNKNYLKRPQVFKHLSNGDSSHNLLVNTAISRNVIEASKQAAPISYVTIKPASDLQTEDTYTNPTEPNVTVVKKSSVDYSIVPRIAVAVMSSKESTQNHNTTNLVFASGEEVARNPTTITTLGTRQIVSSLNTPTLLASIPQGSFIETTSFNQFASTDNNSLILENGRIIRGSLVPKYSPPEPQIFSNGAMEGEAMEVIETRAVVPSSGSPDNATVTTAVYESGGGTAIVDSHGGMATLIKGAEVVRSSAVSYATPIMHQVYFQPNTESIVDSIEEGYEEVNVSVTTDISSSPMISSTSSSDDESSSSKHRAPSSSLLQLRRVCNQSVVQDDESPMNLCVNQSAESGPTGPRDDELTPLTWLQDTNLLKSTALSPVKHKQQLAATSTTPHLMAEQLPKVSTKHFQPTTPPGRHPAYGVEPMREVKAESPTSDYGGEESNERSSETPPGGERTGGTVRAQTVTTYGPKMQVSSKPPYSFSCLIFMAIEDSEEKALPVKSIYAWVLHHFPHYRTANAGWKNSVRHNLSLNKCFKKVDKSPNMGKGSLWMVDPEHRATLLQSLSKVPFHPYSSLERVHSLSLRHGGVHNSRNGDPHMSLHQDPSLLGTSPASIFGKEVQYRPNPSRYNNHHQSSTGADNHRQNDTKYSRSVTTYSNKVTSKGDGGNTAAKFDNLDPGLFPYLSRTFSSGSIGILDGVGVEDVHAAAAMLTLKHGHDPLTSIQHNLSRLTADDQGRYKATSQTQKTEPVVMVISSSAGQDHSYTNQPSTLYSSSHSARGGKMRGEKLSTSPTSSVDEAFSEESFESDTGDTQNSPSDIQQMVDGADALLNFAARATTMLPRLNFYDNSLPASSASVSKSSQQQRVIYITQYSDGSTSEVDNNNKRPLVSNNEMSKRLKVEQDEEEADSSKKIRRVRKVVDTKHIVTQGGADNLQTPSKIRTLNLSSRPAFLDSNKATVRKYKALDEGTNRKGRRIGIQSKSSRVYLHSRR